MLITKVSPLTGKENSMEINVSPQELAHWQMTKHLMIQDAFPHLTADEREFLLTGYTPEDWDAIFPEESNED